MIGWEDSPRSTAIPSIENTTTIIVSTPDPPPSNSDETEIYPNILMYVPDITTTRQRHHSGDRRLVSAQPHQVMSSEPES